MLERMYGQDVAISLIQSQQIPVGFTHLYERQRLDLTVEALVLRPKWHGLFVRDTLVAARQRLEAYHHEFAHDDWDGTETPRPRPTPSAADIADIPARRVETASYRILRDTELARLVKQLHNYQCQLCGHTITLPDGSQYAEAHHIQPLGSPHNGPDSIGNILCLCPNHHAELDYLVISLGLELLRGTHGHVVERKYIDYHNRIRSEAACE
jgi:hypothetical protein